MATNQQVIQNLVQNVSGTHTAGQANVPSAGQSGNPNTPYNWTTYLPKLTPSGQVNFQLLTSKAPASSPGYTTPFTADPYAAAVLASIPKPQGNSYVNNMLSRMFSGQPVGTTPPGGTAPPGGSTPPPGGSTPPPSGGNNPPPYWSVETAGIPAGPLSGPTYRNLPDWQTIYNHLMPQTTPSQYYGNLWPGSPQQTTRPPSSGAPSGSTDPSNPVSSAVKKLFSWVGNEWDEFVDNVTLQNGWAGLASELLGALGAAAGIPGANLIMDNIMRQIDNEVQSGALDLSQAEARMQEVTANVIQNLMNQTGSAAMNSIINDFIAQQQAKLDPTSNATIDWTQFYNSRPEMSRGEWDRLMNHFNFVSNFTSGTMHDQLMQEMEANVKKMKETFKTLPKVY